MCLFVFMRRVVIANQQIVELLLFGANCFSMELHKKTWIPTSVCYNIKDQLCFNFPFLREYTKLYSITMQRLTEKNVFHIPNIL